MEVNDPRAVKFVLLHPFIALILSHHSSAETSTIGKAVSDALNVFYGQMGKTYEDAKKEQDKLIDYIIMMAEHKRLPIVKEKLREQLKQGLPKAFKIVDKLLPDNSKEHAILLKNAFRYHVKDPLVLFKQAGIDIEPELEEFRQFLAEISGKEGEGIPAKDSTEKIARLDDFKLEVLSLLKAVELTGERERAVKKLSKMIRELSREKLNRENALRLGVLAFALELLGENRLDRMGEIKEL